MKKFLIFLIWFFSLIIVSFYTYEHPETIERIKHYIKFYKTYEDFIPSVDDIQNAVSKLKTGKMKGPLGITPENILEWQKSR